MKVRMLVIISIITLMFVSACENPFFPEKKGSDVVVINYSVANVDQWNDARNAINNGGNNKNYSITVINNFDMPGSTANTFGMITGVTVSISGNNTLSLTGDGYLLCINTGQIVILNNLKLCGHASNSNSLVFVNGGSFIMQGSSTVYNNTTGGHGGGVRVDDGGSFIMQNNSSVYGNTAYRGGGVGIDDGIFTMQGNSSLYGNTAGEAGGVYVYGGFFTMQNNSSIFGNTGITGGGVGVEYGTFRLAGGTVVGSSDYGDKAKNTDTQNAAALAVFFGTATYGGANGSAYNIPLVDSRQNNTITQAGVIE